MCLSKHHQTHRNQGMNRVAQTFAHIQCNEIFWTVSIGPFIKFKQFKAQLVFSNNVKQIKSEKLHSIWRYITDFEMGGSNKKKRHGSYFLSIRSHAFSPRSSRCFTVCSCTAAAPSTHRRAFLSSMLQIDPLERIRNAPILHWEGLSPSPVHAGIAEHNLSLCVCGPCLAGWGAHWV